MFFCLPSPFCLNKCSPQMSSKPPYESGYDHGCDDAKISDPGDRYINQPERGPSFHTDEFMEGYDDGYVECSDVSNSGSNELAEGMTVVEMLDMMMDRTDHSVGTHMIIVEMKRAAMMHISMVSSTDV
jgi:hypothetical protein